MAADKIIEKALTDLIESVSDDKLEAWFTEFDYLEKEKPALDIWHKLRDEITIASAHNSALLDPPAIFVALTDESERELPVGWLDGFPDALPGKGHYAALIEETVTVFLLTKTLDGLRILHLAVYGILKDACAALLQNGWLSAYHYQGARDVTHETRLEATKGYMRMQLWQFQGIRKGAEVPVSPEGYVTAPAHVASRLDDGLVDPLEQE